MKVLSSYPLPESENRAIADLVEGMGGVFLPASHGEEREEVIARIEEHIGDATIFLGGRLKQEQLDRADQLRWIHVPWAGVNALLALNFESRPDVLITNSRGVMADAVADQVLAYLVMLNRSLPQQVTQQGRSEWKRYQTVEHPDRKILRGSTLGILGYGAIGEQIGVRARACGMRVLGLKNNPTKGGENADELFGPERRDELFQVSDFLVVALPLTDETRGSVGAREFSLMKESAYLINIARGSIVVTDDLIEAIESKKMAGAALDVVDPEPLPEDSVLWSLPGVIITPPSSAGFVGFGGEVAHLFRENLKRYGDGSALLHRVDRALGY